MSPFLPLFLSIALLVPVYAVDSAEGTAVETPQAIATDFHLTERGLTLLIKLMKENPGAPNIGGNQGPLYTVAFSIKEGLNHPPYLELSLPSVVWSSLSNGDQLAIAAGVRHYLGKARNNPELYITLDQSAPAYSLLKQEIQQMPDDAWRIDVGHFDADGHLVIDKTVMQGMPLVSARAASQPSGSSDASKLSDSMPSSPSADSNLLIQGEALYKKLKHDYPDAKMLPDHDLAPHTVNAEVVGAIGGTAYVDLSMPEKVWNKLNQSDKDALVAFLKSKIIDARAHPESYADLNPRAPAYPGQVENIGQIQDNAWQVHTGHLDDEGYLDEDKLVLQGADYSQSARPVLIYADAKTDSVYNSGWDGSVRQVTEYLSKTLNDADSVKYSDWTKVVKTGTGYQVSVTYRAKNAFGAYILKDQTFAFDKSGAITKVATNE